jgi:hypothetical protein
MRPTGTFLRLKSPMSIGWSRHGEFLGHAAI